MSTLSSEKQTEADTAEEDTVPVKRSTRKLRSNHGVSIWENFTKVGERAECNLCHKTYNYSTTVGNLKAHLAQCHIDAFPDNEELKRRRERTKPLRPRGPRTVSAVWNYFEKLDDILAECSICKKQLSYKSTVHNLKLHLKNQHPDFAMAMDADREAEVTYEEVQYLNLGNDEDSESSEQMLSDARVWHYFEDEGEGNARCGLCDAPVNVSRLRSHLSGRHPGVMAAIIEKGTDDEEEKPFTRAARKDPLHSRNTHVVKKRKTLQYPQPDSSDDDEPIIKRKDEAQETFLQHTPHKNRRGDIQDTFLQYIGTLLQDTPHDLHLQLQRDIVNLIMNARLAHERQVTNAQLLSCQFESPKSSDANEMKTEKVLDDRSAQQRYTYQVVLPESVGSDDFKKKVIVDSIVAVEGRKSPVSGDGSAVQTVVSTS